MNSVYMYICTPLEYNIELFCINRSLSFSTFLTSYQHVLSTVAEKPEEKKFARGLAGDKIAGVAVSPARTLFFPEKKRPVSVPWRSCSSDHRQQRDEIEKQKATLVCYAPPPFVHAWAMAGRPGGAHVLRRSPWTTPLRRTNRKQDRPWRFNGDTSHRRRGKLACVYKKLNR